MPVTASPSTVTVGGVAGASGAAGAGGVCESSVQAARTSPPKLPRRKAVRVVPPSGIVQVTVVSSPGFSFCSSGEQVPPSSSVPVASVMWKRMSAGFANRPSLFFTVREARRGESGEACEGTATW